MTGLASAPMVRIQRRVRDAVRPSPRVLETAAMFGLGVDERRWLTIVPPVDIPLPQGGIVFVTGPSGGGKSTVLELLGRGVRARGGRVLSFQDLPALPDRPLVDALDRPLKCVMSLLALVGLGDAFVMLRRPREISDGQRYRLRLAQLIDRVERESRETIPGATPRAAPGAGGHGTIILADEFGAALDRLTASVIARNLARWVQATPHTLVVATTHDELLEALQPHVLVYKGLGDHIEVVTR